MIFADRLGDLLGGALSPEEVGSNENNIKQMNKKKITIINLIFIFLIIFMDRLGSPGERIWIPGWEEIGSKK